MNLCLCLSLLIACVLCLTSVASHGDDFHEKLLFRALEDGSLFAEFVFDTISPLSSIKSPFYHLFPKTIGELFIRFNLHEFDLTLSRGYWFNHLYGTFNPNVAPIGAELTAMFYKDNNNSNNNTNSGDNNDDDWLVLQSILSGIYCSSINEIESQISNPNINYRETDDTFTKDLNFSYYYGILPRENICTENLTPWSKLLPCRRHVV